jgi:hypothetical protein
VSSSIVKPTGKLPELYRTSMLKAAYGTVLGYGPAGAGKTRSIKTLVAHRLKPLIIVTELGQTGGLLSIAAEDIPYVVVHTHQEILDVIRAMKRKPDRVEYAGEEAGAVVLDSITQWGEFPLERYMALKGWSDLHGPVEKGQGKDPRTAYGFLAEKGRQLYKELFDLHCHLYIIAREGLFGGDEGVPLFNAPELPGQKLPRELPGWPDATVRLRVINGKFKMVTRGEGLTPARVRLSESVKQLPIRCEPDIGALIKYMIGDESVYPLLAPAGAPKDEKEEEPPAAAAQNA